MFSVKSLNSKCWLKTCYLLCKSTSSTRETRMTERIFKLTPIHASVIYQILWIQWIQRKGGSNLVKLHYIAEIKTTAYHHWIATWIWMQPMIMNINSIYEIACKWSRQPGLIGEIADVTLRKVKKWKQLVSRVFAVSEVCILCTEQPTSLFCVTFSILVSASDFGAA